MSKEEIIKKLLEQNIETGVKYHSPLPDDISQWYVYTRKSGHRILCVLKKDLAADMTQAEYENLLVSAAVKTVLHGYTVENGFVVIDSDYDIEKGFCTEELDREFALNMESRKYALTVGGLYLPGRTTWPEAVEYNYFSNNHELRFFLKNPSRYVTEVIRKMPVQLGLFMQGDIILLVYRFIDYKKQLVPVNGYSPFSIHLVPENMRTIPEIKGDMEEGGLLRIHLVDADTGVLKAARTVALSPEFSAALSSAIVEQSNIPLTDDYNDRLLEIDRRYPDNESLMDNCRERCAG